MMPRRAATATAVWSRRPHPRRAGPARASLGRPSRRRASRGESLIVSSGARCAPYRPLVIFGPTLGANFAGCHAQFMGSVNYAPCRRGDRTKHRRSDVLTFESPTKQPDHERRNRRGHEFSCDSRHLGQFRGFEHHTGLPRCSGLAKFSLILQLVKTLLRVGCGLAKRLGVRWRLFGSRAAGLL